MVTSKASSLTIFVGGRLRHNAMIDRGQAEFSSGGNSGIDVTRLSDGTLVLAYNPSDCCRTPLRLSLSTDNGATWPLYYDLETAAGEYSYPGIISWTSLVRAAARLPSINRWASFGSRFVAVAMPLTEVVNLARRLPCRFTKLSPSLLNRAQRGDSPVAFCAHQGTNGKVYEGVSVSYTYNRQRIAYFSMSKPRLLARCSRSSPNTIYVATIPVR